MKVPGPDHPITITPSAKRIQALFQGHLIADSDRALILKEASYKPVQYFPREDVAMAYLSSTAHSTHCPYKGDASYFTVTRDATIAENAVWSYEDPFPAMEQIKGYVAFYPNQIEIHELGDTVPAAVIRDVVEHTDSGSGQSQLDHWEPTGEEPSGR